jgi:hypothetical protein
MIRLKSLLPEDVAAYVPISQKQAAAVARKLGVADKIDIEELRRGMEVEQEHLATIKKLDGESRAEAVARIALDHLKELPNYYTRLKKVEQ